ncbi:DUF4129 domain-containing protein [Flavobacterium branchiophilum]|uniref:DUF4129 domain-containing protein n=1 Tax=Flavobacterium branchiophilum (strain FL-15) TaxID=1034807 RepID=G2Z1H0_FLABF|nr:hypothetical protein [Flavobacterium branchiophilum]CCB69738.1 Hypothetical protein FBFL15_1677 [Flavobacterium branchiophilum FL-15]
MNKLLKITSIFLLVLNFGLVFSKNLKTNPIQNDTAHINIRQYKPLFKQEYTDKEFIYENKSSEKNIWDKFINWLHELFGGSNHNQHSVLNYATIDVILRILSIILIIFVVYMIVKSFLNKEAQWIFGKNSEQKVIQQEMFTQNIHEIDFEKLIQKAIKNKSNRLTIRYYYLWLLQTLSDQKLIEWDKEKTNSDYIYELKSTKHKNDFSYLSYLYNNIWYGEFQITDYTYEQAIHTFKKALKEFKNE